MKDKEAAERTALAAKQEADAAEGGAAHVQAKWSEHLEEAIARAKGQGMTQGGDFEGYCIQETIGRVLSHHSI